MKAPIRLTRVTVKNFRGLKEVAVDLKDRTVLIGENNTGKTTFLRAIQIVLEAGKGRRGAVLEPFDFHLHGDAEDPTLAPPIEITLEFQEPAEDAWPDVEVQALGDAAAFLPDNRRRIALRGTAKYDPEAPEPSLDLEFLDAKDKPARLRDKPHVLQRLRALRPFFFLSALRDASREFTRGSSFWGPFVRQGTLTGDQRKEIEEAIAGVNRLVVESHAPFRDVREGLSQAHKVVSVGSGDAVSIDALPTRLFDLLSRTQVNLVSGSGVRLPLHRHGEGTQSLSVLLLFDAFVRTRLAQDVDRNASPVVALEEPEAHLHPAAVRALWAVVAGMDGQKVVATHSGDLLAEVPLDDVRRFSRDGDDVVVHAVSAGDFHDDELCKINQHVRRTRGEILFARAWLLVEGACESAVLDACGRALGADLDRHGIRLVEYPPIGLDTLLKTADALGISWHVLADGDAGGRNHARTVRKRLGTRSEPSHLSVEPFDDDIERLLCERGFIPEYESLLSPQKAKDITVSPGHADYPAQLAKATNDKLEAATLVADRILTEGPTTVPAELKAVLEAALALVGGRLP